MIFTRTICPTFVWKFSEASLIVLFHSQSIDTPEFNFFFLFFFIKFQSSTMASPIRKTIKINRMPSTVSVVSNKQNSKIIPFPLPHSIQGQQNRKTKTTDVIKSTSRSVSQSSSSGSCRAYEMAELYRQRREFQLRKIKEEEERLRRHKAKPMPNFKAIHKALTMPKESAVVSPETPEVLRRGLATKEKQKQKVKWNGAVRFFRFGFSHFVANFNR